MPSPTAKPRRRAPRRGALPTLRALAAQCLIVAAIVGSAIAAKEFGRQPVPLAAFNMPAPQAVWLRTAAAPTARIVPPPLGAPMEAEAPSAAALTIDTLPPELGAFAADPSVRWFNNRPVRPARDVWMEVTAYSPDWRSCGDSADGLTATLHSVETNGHALVAADPTILPYGSMLTIPGYDKDRIVPVLDCGGAIKGHRLDVLFPTHEAARQWGRQRLRVIVWEFADGLPPENPRALR